MAGIIIGAILAIAGGITGWGLKKKAIGAPLLIIGAVVLGVSMVVAGIV